VFKPPVVLAYKALVPIDVLEFPLVLHLKELTPIAVLLIPVVLANKAVFPNAVFFVPVVLLTKARYPTAVLHIPPAVLLTKAPHPIPVFVAILPPPLPTLTKLNTESEVVDIEPDTKTLCVNGLT
jgi:hypothetical protein